MTANHPKVLFFGRDGCDATRIGLDHLKSLGFDVTFVLSKGRGEKMPKSVSDWSGDYIFCFRSLFILRKRLLDKAKIAAVNFHPAPVEYPGSGCINFALYDEASLYGVTAHIMNEKVDNGAVLECRRFPIEPDDNLDSLLSRTHAALLEQFLDITKGIAENGQDFITRQMHQSQAEKWSGKARRLSELDQLQEISPDADATEIARVIRATYTERFPPKIKLHGYEFVLKNPLPDEQE